MRRILGHRNRGRRYTRSRLEMRHRSPLAGVVSKPLVVSFARDPGSGARQRRASYTKCGRLPKWHGSFGSEAVSAHDREGIMSLLHDSDIDIVIQSPTSGMGRGGNRGHRQRSHVIVGMVDMNGSNPAIAIAYYAARLYALAETQYW